MGGEASASLSLLYRRAVVMMADNWRWVYLIQGDRTIRYLENAIKKEGGDPAPLKKGDRVVIREGLGIILSEAEIKGQNMICPACREEMFCTGPGMFNPKVRSFACVNKDCACYIEKSGGFEFGARLKKEKEAKKKSKRA